MTAPSNVQTLRLVNDRQWRRMERGDCTTNWRHPLSPIVFGGLPHDAQLQVHLAGDHHVHPHDLDTLDLFDLIARHIVEHSVPTEPHCRSCRCHIGGAA